MFLVNAFYLYNWYKVLSSEKITKAIFRHEIATALVGPQLSNLEYQALPNFHYLAKLPPTEKKLNPIKSWRICTKNKVQKESRYFCKKCNDNPALCVDPCFWVYQQQCVENITASSKDDKQFNQIDIVQLVFEFLEGSNIHNLFHWKCC